MKKILTLTLALALLLSSVLCFASCGKNDEKTLVIGASSTPHAEILEFAKPIFEAKGYKLDIRVFDDYVLPNTALENGELDANYFQHLPYLQGFNADNGTHLVSVGAIHYEPFGLYGNGVTAVSAIGNGVKVLIPSDGSNCTRALFLLQQEGLITLKAGATAAAGVTIYDIESNPKNLDIVPVEAQQIPAQLANADAGTVAVINGNYAIGAGLKIADALATESANGEAASLYANIVAVKVGNENLPKILALIEALEDPTVSQYIRDTYNGAVVSMK